MLKEIWNENQQITLKAIQNLYAYVRGKAHTKDKVGPLKDDKGNIISNDADLCKLLNDLFQFGIYSRERNYYYYYYTYQFIQRRSFTQKITRALYKNVTDCKTKLQYLDRLTDDISSANKVNWVDMHIETGASLGPI